MKSGSERNGKKDIILYFQVHQPQRLQAVNFFDIAGSPHYFNDALNESIIRRVAKDCYLPANDLLYSLIQEMPGVKIAFSLSGLVIEQLKQHAPEAIEGFKRLAATGSVEFLAETYYHSLASLVKGDEFEIQVLQHAELIFETFGVRPSIFRNTELIYNDEIGKRVAMMGFRGIFTEGHEVMLGQRTPHALYSHPDHPDFRILLRNYRLSDDIAFRFTQGASTLSVRQYMRWLEGMPPGEDLICLAMDYETFGEHHKAESGIFDFLRSLLTSVAKSDRYSMLLPAEAVNTLRPAGELSVSHYLSWADVERDLSAWLGNDMQRDAFNSIMKLEADVKGLGNKSLLTYWRTLQTSDHFYYMSLKTDNDGSVHSYFSPFPSSYEAFINYMNVVTHLTSKIQVEKNNQVLDDHDPAAWEAERQAVKANTPAWVMNLESVPPANIP